jgi:hypothetical protein
VWWKGCKTRLDEVAAGEEATTTAAAGAASDALMVVAADRGREEYRVTVAGTEMVVLPGLTPDGEIDLEGLRRAVLSLGDRLDGR